MGHGSETACQKEFYYFLWSKCVDIIEPPTHGYMDSKRIDLNGFDVKEELSYLTRYQRTDIYVHIKTKFYLYSKGKNQNKEWLLVHIGSNQLVAPAEFEELDYSPGIFARLVLDGLNLVGSEHSILIDHVYAEIDLIDTNFIKNSFERFTAYRFLAPQEFEDPENNNMQITDAVLSFIVENPSILITLKDFEPNMLTVIRKFTTQSRKIPTIYFCDALLEYRWRSAFVEIYRCIESMFPIVWIEKMLEGSTDNDLIKRIDNIFLAFDRELKWKPNEAASLKEMFQAIPESDITVANQRLGFLSVPKNLYEQFYNVRNSIVHSRKSFDSVTFSDLQWNEIFFLGIKIIDSVESKCSKVMRRLF